MGKMCTFFLLASVIFFCVLKKFLLANNTGCNFCLWNILRCRRDCEKNENLIIAKNTGYTVMCKSCSTFPLPRIQVQCSSKSIILFLKHMVHEDNYTTVQCTSKLGQRYKGHLRNQKNTLVQNLHIFIESI